VREGRTAGGRREGRGRRRERWRVRRCWEGKKEGGSERGGWSEHKKNKKQGTRESDVVGYWTAVARTQLCRLQGLGFRV
jgi:hypothetical protein